MRTILALLIPAVLAGGTLAQGKVLVVGLGRAYASPQEAIDAASDGDTILVENGSYMPFLHLSGKSLTIVGDGAGVDVGTIAGILTQTNRIENVPAGGLVVLRGMHLGNTSLSFNAGTVVIEDCTLGHEPQGSVALTAFASEAVVVARTLIQGADGNPGGPFTPAVDPNVALHAIDSDLFLEDCGVVGGDGLDAADTPLVFNLRGETGLVQQGGSLWASSTAFVGGDGGDGDAGPPCEAGGDGAPGVELTDVAVVVRASVAAGGFGGAGAGACAPGADAPAASVTGGTLQLFPGPAPGFTADSPAREGETVVARVTGVPGDSAFVLFASDPTVVLLAAFSGVLYAGPPFQIFSAGALDATGAASLAKTVPELGPGIEGATIWLQGATCNVAGTCTLAPGSSVTMLDAAF